MPAKFSEFESLVSFISEQNGKYPVDRSAVARFIIGMDERIQLVIRSAGFREE